MTPIFPISEDDLIAFHLGEPCDEAAIRAQLETDPALAALSVSIAETLRVFSADPVPPTSPAAAWARLRPSLLPLHRPSRFPARFRHLSPWITLPTSALAAAALLFAVVLGLHRLGIFPRDEYTTVCRLQAPMALARDPAVAQHLDRAERWLTEVSHSPQPLDPASRDEAQHLLLRNAVYIQSARDSNDLADAAVLEKLGRVLTTASHDHTADPGWHIRLEMNTDGLLFEIRVLHENRSQLPAATHADYPADVRFNVLRKTTDRAPSDPTGDTQ